MNLKHQSKIIYGNVAFFVYVILAAMGGIYQRQTSADWNAMNDVRMEYNILFGFGFVFFSLISIIGLLKNKEWGRIAAITFNWFLFFSFFIMRLGAYFITKYFYGTGIVTVDMDAIAIACLSLFFMICLTRGDMKTKFRSG